MTWMILRLILSLAFVGGVLWFAARVAKKRGLGGSNQGLIEVVARQRMGRSSSLNVVRIGDVVLVVGATEEQITLLAEVDNETIGATPVEPAEVPAPRVPERAAQPMPAARPPQPQPRRRPDADGFEGAGYADESYRIPDRHEPRYAGEGYAADGYAADGYAADGYAADRYSSDGYGQGGDHQGVEPAYEPGYDQGHPQTYDQGYDQGYDQERVERRPGGHHAEGPRHGSGTRRPAAAPGASSAALAGSVFDKNGWGTFVNELRERTVRRP